VILCTEEIIQEDDIILPGQADVTRMSFQELKANVISQFESNYLQNVLTACRGNITKAAQVAQKERRTFWALVRKHNIDVQKFRAPDYHERGNHQSALG
jgi:DNA-binding NtrC family response regulator